MKDFAQIAFEELTAVAKPLTVDEIYKRIESESKIGANRPLLYYEAMNDSFSLTQRKLMLCPHGISKHTKAPTTRSASESLWMVGCQVLKQSRKNFR